MAITQLIIYKRENKISFSLMPLKTLPQPRKKEFPLARVYTVAVAAPPPLSLLSSSHAQPTERERESSSLALGRSRLGAMSLALSVSLSLLPLSTLFTRPARRAAVILAVRLRLYTQASSLSLSPRGEREPVCTRCTSSSSATSLFLFSSGIDVPSGYRGYRILAALVLYITFRDCLSLCVIQSSL